MTGRNSGIFLVILFLALFVATLYAQRAVQRLILKDGTYQTATKYEIKGDRVRYLSAERAEWEEIPASLVDWDATKKWQEQQSHPVESTVQSQEELKKIEAEDQAERAAQEAKTPLVAPNLWLPETGGVFLLDIYRDQPEVTEMKPNEGDVNKEKGKNLVRAAVNPVASAKESIELPNAHALVQAHVPDPAIFVNLREDEAVPPAGVPVRQWDPGQMRIVRVEVTPKGKRIVGKVKVNLMGKVTEKEDIVEIQAEPYHGSAWIRITPKQHLDPGQYALVEMVDANRINIDAVYDFGVNPAAPDNAEAVQAAAAAKEAAAKDEALKKRKQKNSD